jgi:hypothetical protein
MNINADKVLENVKIIKKYKLTKPVTIADKTYSELELNFNDLTSEDMESVAGLPGCNSGDANMNEFSKTYLMHIVALAAGITINEVRKFPIPDGTVLTMMAQVFLLSAVSKITTQ